jgi:phenylacetate-CoA ligase
VNIALLIDTLAGGGAEGVVQRLAGGLARRGHRVFIYCLKTAGTAVDRLGRAGVLVREAKSRGRDPLLGWRLTQWLHADRVEVAHAHNCAAMVWALPAAKLRSIPLIHVRHGSLLGRATLYRRLADRLDHLIDRIVVVSESDRAQLPAGRLARHAVQISNGIDLEPMEPRASRALLERLCDRRLSGPVVLAVGTICAEKDTCGLLRAFKMLRHHLPDATLVWVGPEREQGYALQVRGEIDALALGTSVILAGPVDGAWRLMAGADVFCLSSATEAMPNVIVEAMSQRVPVVATAVGDVGGLDSRRGSADRTLIQHRQTGLLVPPRDPRALADALREALDDRPASRARVARATARYTRFFTGQQMVRRYERVYTECIRRRGSPKPTQTRGLARHRRPGVLMVGPGVEQIGGMTSVIDALMTSPLGEKYALRRLSQTFDVLAAHERRERDRLSRMVGVLSAATRHADVLCRLAHIIRRERIDIVHIHTCSFFSFYRSLLDLAVAKLLRCRVYLHIHGGKFVEFCAGSGRCGRWLIRCGCEAADGVILLSRRWLDGLRPYLRNARTVVIPNGAQPSPALAMPNLRDDRACRFLFLGALAEEKGLAELIEAAARVQQVGAPFELILAGPAADQERERWEHRVRSSGLERVVRFAGVVQGAAKAELLASADCLVLPSHAEGLPMVLLEAAMAALPLIATSVGSIPELMTPEGSPADNDGSLAPLVPPRDPAALAREMARLADDPKARRAIGARLWAHVAANYSVERQAERISRLYEALPPQQAERRAKPARTRAEHVSSRASEWIVRHLTYPLHETLRGRPTLKYLSEMGRFAASPSEVARRECATRLRELLCFAAKHLPYYRELFARRGVNPQAADPQRELVKLPVLEKADVRANAEQMVYRGVPGGLIPCGSGGTTGDTLRFFVDRNRQAQPLACRLFMQSLFGVRPGDRRVYLWASPIESKRARVRQWRDRLINERLLDAFDMGPAAMNRHLEAIRSFQPRLIYAYPSAAALLAKHAAQRYGPRDFPWLRLVVLTGEEVGPDQVARVRETFGCLVASEYGSREVGLIAHECPHGGLHIMSPHVHVEVAAGGKAVPAGRAGEVLCTTLTTRGQPFIRYRVGDVGALIAGPCPCGLPFPQMRIEGGKITGFVVLRDGRLCHGAVSSYALRDEPGIVEFKTFQRAIDRFEVLLVVDDRFDRSAITRIRRRYRALFGPQVQIDCYVVDRIPPDPSGKRRHVVSDVAPDWAGLEPARALEPEEQPAELLR